jgi:hypothetical protein
MPTAWRSEIVKADAPSHFMVRYLIDAKEL